MSTLRIRVAEQVAEHVLLRLTIDEAERLGLPLLDGPVDIVDGTRQVTGVWDARSLELYVPDEQPPEPRRGALLSRRAVGGLHVTFTSRDESHTRQGPTPGNDIRSALHRGHFAAPKDLELAAEIERHRAQGEYRSRRLAATSVSPPGWSWRLDSDGPDHQLVIGPRLQRMSLAVDWCIEALNAGPVQRVYLAVTPGARSEWLRVIDQAATRLDGGVARTQISVVPYQRLTSWKPPVTATCLLVLDEAEQATRRWPDRVGPVLQRATRSLCLGDPANDEQMPGWAIEVMDALGNRAGVVVLPVPAVPSLRRHLYLPTPTEHRARRDLAMSLAGTIGCQPWHSAWIGIFGAHWRSPVPATALTADHPRLGAVLDAFRELHDQGTRVEVMVASMAAADELWRWLPERALANGSVRIRVGRGAPPVDQDVRILYADLTPLVQRPDALGEGIVVCADDTGDEALFTLANELTTLTSRPGSDVDQLVKVLPAGWARFAIEVLLGNESPDQVLARARQLVHHQQQRATRLARDRSLPTRLDPVSSSGADPTPTDHSVLITKTLNFIGVNVGLAEAGTGVLRVTSAEQEQTTFPPGTRLAAEPTTAASAAPGVPLFAGTPGAERLFHRVLEARVSMEVSDLDDPLNLPVSPHAARLRLVSRRYLPPRTVEVHGTYLHTGAPVPTTTDQAFGVAARTGRSRRSAPVSREDPSIPETALLEGLVDQLEARAEPDHRLLTARFVAGDDVGLEETWRRDDGTQLVLTCSAPLVGPPVFVDLRGSPIRELDTCDAGHPADAASIERCNSCPAERCPSCQDARVTPACRLCSSLGCPSCVSGHLCPRCRQPQRVPELDQPGTRAWRVPGANVLVGRTMVTIHRDGRSDPDIHVPDEQCTAELDVRRRGLLHEQGVELDAAVLLEPAPDLDDATGLLANDEPGEQWLVLDEPSEGCEPIRDARLLGAHTGPTVRPLSAVGIGPAWLQSRHRQAALPPSRCLVLRRYIDRSELTITAQGLRWSTIRHWGDGTLEPIDVQGVDLHTPVTPRNDQDGRLIAVGHAGEMALELLSLNASAVLRVRRLGVTQDLFAPASSGVSHGSETAWHGLARSYSVDDDAVLVAPQRALQGARPARFAAPGDAQLVERTVIPSATFTPPTGDVRPIGRSDLAALQRQVVEPRSTALRPRDAGLLRDLVASRLPSPPRPLEVGVCFTVNEEWRAWGRRELAYRAQDGEPALPPLDDTGEPGEQFTVDSAGHLHLTDNGYACEACDRHYCTACPTPTQLDECVDCRQSACGPCRTNPRTRRSVEVVQCARCHRRSCVSCGRDLRPTTCACCGRKLCRWCIPDGVACCQTCDMLAAGFDGSVPDAVPVDGCTLFAARDRDAQIIGICGAQRREVLTLRDGELARWATFEPDLRLTVSAISAARRWGRDLRIDGFAREDGPLHEPSENCVWSRLTSELEIGLRNQKRLRIDLTGRELLDALADALADDGPYPVPAVADPGLPQQLRFTGSGRVLRLVRREARRSIEVDRNGLLQREDRWHPRRSIEQARSSWQRTSTDSDGRTRWMATLGPVQATVLIAGGDVELRVGTDDQLRTHVLASSPADRCTTQLLHAAGWKDPASTAVTALLIPGDAVPLAISGRALEDRQLSLRARASESTTGLPGDTLLDACARLGWQPPEPSPEHRTSRFAAVTERFATEPNAAAIIGLAVHETFAGGIHAEYEMWPNASSTRYEYEGALVRQLAIDASGHIVTEVEVCRYCTTWTCGACEQAVRGCDVCGIKLCRACSPPYDFRVCPACFRLAAAPLWTSRRLFSRPKPWRFVQGEDFRHQVTIGRSSGGLRLVSHGDHHVNDVALTPASALAAFLSSAFDRKPA